MTDVAVRDRLRGREELELVDAFTEQALAIAASAASPNTRRSYATAYRAFAAFLHERYGQASLQTFTVTAVAAWRDELTAQGLAASTVAPSGGGGTSCSRRSRRASSHLQTETPVRWWLSPRGARVTRVAAASTPCRVLAARPYGLRIPQPRVCRQPHA